MRAGRNHPDHPIDGDELALELASCPNLEVVAFDGNQTPIPALARTVISVSSSSDCAEDLAFFVWDHPLVHLHLPVFYIGDVTFRNHTPKFSSTLRSLYMDLHGEVEGPIEWPLTLPLPQLLSLELSCISIESALYHLHFIRQHSISLQACRLTLYDGTSDQICSLIRLLPPSVRYY